MMKPVFRFVDHTVAYDGKITVLTEREAAVLGVLCGAKGRVITKGMMTMQIWPIMADEPKGPKDTLDQFIHHLRVKLGPLGIEIITVQGHGWYLPDDQIEIDWSNAPL